MNNIQDKVQAREEFHKLRQKSLLGEWLNVILPNKYNELLSFYDVRDLLGDIKQETYLGLCVVPIDKIIGSEGRYQDFTRSFLPKAKHLQERWVNISAAVRKDIILPPIQLFKVGDVYFVRDGNHRVSVARANGVEMIDAEVREIASHIYISADMTHQEILQRVIEYERNTIFKETRLANFIDTNELKVTMPGSYSILIQHIMGHKYFITQERNKEPAVYPEEEALYQQNHILAQYQDTKVSFGEAAQSWYSNLFQPITEHIYQEKLLSKFPKRTPADLYIWLISHWHHLKTFYDQDISFEEAVEDAISENQKASSSSFSQFFARLKRKA